MNLRTSAMARLGVMGILMIGLMIPLTMVQAIVSERATRRDSVVEYVGGTWGGPQTIGGPVLAIPYRYTSSDTAGRVREQTAWAYVLPDALDIQGTMDPSTRQRGLFKVVVYKSRLQLRGQFARPNMTGVRPAPTEVLWSDAIVSLGVSDARGIARRVVLRWNGTDVPLVPGVEASGLFGSGLRGNVGGLASTADGARLPFTLELEINGSRELRFLPSGSDTSVRLTSTWAHPSFVGSPLPASNEVAASGFTANWSVPYFGRGYPPLWTSAAVDPAAIRQHADGSAFGVALVQPVDVYQQTERAVKYAALFIVLTFVIFFLWETVRARLLHPVQYLFVGFAMCVFYLLLLSISEHLGFDIAYVSAAGATTALIGVYSIFMLGGIIEGGLMGAALVGLYAFLYLLLRLEDYSLLAGSVGLFVMLAVLMICTRHVNWYDLRLGGSKEQTR